LRSGICWAVGGTLIEATVETGSILNS